MLILPRITPGLTGSAETVVTPDQTAPFVGSGRIAVLATPVMINLIEAAALAAVEHLPPAGHQQVARMERSEIRGCPSEDSAVLSVSAGSGGT